MTEKAEWERLVDDSYQWQVGQYICILLVLVSWGLLIFVDVAWFVAEVVFLILYFAFRGRERWMLNKAIRLRKEERNDDRR